MNPRPDPAAWRRIARGVGARVPLGLLGWALAAWISLGPAPAVAAGLRVTVVNAAGAPLSDAAVMLEPLGGRGPARPPAATEVSQQDKQFLPAVTVVPVGTRIDFPNRDTVRHHLYSFSEAKRFEIKLYIGKPAQPVLFDRPGVVVLGCNIHDSMIGWIVVTDAPWFGRSGPGGRVQLDDVPPGRYRLRTWHPVLAAGHPGVEQTLTLSADAELVVRLGSGL